MTDDNTLDFSESLSRWEAQLSLASAPYDQVDILDRMLSKLTYINFDKADLYLNRYKNILDDHKGDVQLNFQYLLHASRIANQQLQYIKAAELFEQALSLGSSAYSINTLTSLYIDYSGTLLNLKSYEKAYNYFNLASNQLSANQDQNHSWHLQLREGQWHLRLSNFAEAMRLLMNAVNGYKSGRKQDYNLRDHYMGSQIYSGIGHLHQHTSEYSKAITATLKALDICNTYGINTRRMWYCVQVGRAYLALGDDENCQKYSRKALALEVDVDPLAQAAATANLGHCALEAETAFSLYEEAESLYLKHNPSDMRNLFTIDIWRSALHQKLGNDKLEEKYLLAASERAIQLRDHKLITTVCYYLSEYYAGQNNFTKAYQYLKLKNDNEQPQKQHALLELEVKYESERRKREAEQHQRQALKLQMKALRAQINPHFFSNTLNAIQHHINEGSKNNKTAVRYLADFAEYMRDCLQYSEMEIVSLEDEISFLKEYLYLNQQLRLQSKHMSYEIIVDEDVEEDICTLPTMLVQPYVENAIEHGIRSIQNGKIDIHFSLSDDDTLLCSVRDNGIGRKKAREVKRPSQQQFKANANDPRGTDITRERLKLLHLQMKLDNDIDPVSITDLYDESGEHPAGTIVKIIIPLIANGYY